MITMQKIIGIFFLAAFLSIIGAGHSVVSASQGSQWQPDQRVSGYLDDTFTPYLLADQNRTVHAFASQRLSDQLADHAIVYRKWTLANGWTLPIDVIALPQGDAQIQGAFLDANGVIHIIFWGGSPRDAHIYYSYVFISDADRGPAWSPPVIIGEKAAGIGSAYLAGDGKGNLVVIYSGVRDGNGVYTTTSKDGGESWLKSQPLYLTYDDNLTPFSLRLFAYTGQIRATWNVVTNRGGDQSLHFANYDLEKAVWSEPILLNAKIKDSDFNSFGPSFPAMVDNGDEIVIMYNNGNPFSGRPVDPGRPVQMVSTSSNNGDSWSVPVVPFYRHLGRSGEHALVLDSNHVAHALFVQRIESKVGGKYQVIGGMYHSAYENGQWSDPDRFVTTYPAHDVRAVVSQGNVLLVIWRQDPGAEKLHGVWFSYRILDTPELSVKTVPESTTLTSPTSTIETAIPSVLPATPIPDVNLRHPLFLEASPGSGVAFSVFVALFLLIVVVLIYASSRKPKDRH